MKNTKWRPFVLLILTVLLVMVDQGAKIMIDSFYVPQQTEEELMQITNTVHIHPQVNYKTRDKIERYAEKTGLPFAFWKIIDVLLSVVIALIVAFAVWCIYKTADFAGIKSSPRIVDLLMVLVSAAGVSGICDRLFWDGTHDFLCICWQYVSDAGIPRAGHLTSDIKDLYMKVFIVLLIVYLILLLIRFCKFSKDKESFNSFKRDFKDAVKKKFHIKREQS